MSSTTFWKRIVVRQNTLKMNIVIDPLSFIKSLIQAGVSFKKGKTRYIMRDVKQKNRKKIIFPWTMHHIMYIKWLSDYKIDRH